jgi:hypothetical protein
MQENEERYSRVSEAVAEGIHDWNIADSLSRCPGLERDKYRLEEPIE